METVMRGCTAVCQIRTAKDTTRYIVLNYISKITVESVHWLFSCCAYRYNVMLKIVCYI